MQIDYLNDFHKRMGIAGMHATLTSVIIRKDTWRTYGVEDDAEKINIVWTVLCFIMELSLREDDCTKDDICEFIQFINNKYFRYKKQGGGDTWTADDCQVIADLVVNAILSNGGKIMTFRGYDFERGEYRDIPVSYIKNSIIYRDGKMRTSFTISEDGYHMLLGTSEIEANMNISIQELISELQYDKAEFDKALDSIKRMFGAMRMRQQEIADAVLKVRRNAFMYETKEYIDVTTKSFETINVVGENLRKYKEKVLRSIEKFEEEILTKEDEAKLRDMKEIGEYLDRSIIEQEKIISGLTNLQKVISDELDKIILSDTVRKRNFKKEVFDKVIETPALLDSIGDFLHPLFLQEQNRIFNPAIILEPQTVRQEEEEEEYEEVIDDFDEEAWEKEEEKRIQEKMARYRLSLETILTEVIENGNQTLSSICKARENSITTIAPTVTVFKEVWGGLMRQSCLDINEIRSESGSQAVKKKDSFHIGKMLLEVYDAHPDWADKTKIYTSKIPDAPDVSIKGVSSEDGVLKGILVDDARIEIIGE